MGDLLFDDFDVDALLDAQSSDDDGSDLPELERSLDDILNDTEFADILGDSAYVNSSGGIPRFGTANSADPSSNNGPAAAIGLEGETVEGNSRSGLEYRNGNDGQKFSIVDQISTVDEEDDGRAEYSPADDLNVNSVHEILENTNSAIEVFPSSRLENTSQSDRSEAAVEGAETRETKRIVANNYSGWESNGRSLGESGVIEIHPQLANTGYGPRPGDAIAAAAALSRQSGSPRSSTTSRYSKTTGSYVLQKISSAGILENDNNGSEADLNFKREDSSSASQVSDEAAAIQESVSSTLESEEGNEDFQYSGGRFSNDGALEFGSKQGAPNDESGIRWNNDEMHAEAFADLSEEVEILSTLESQLHEEPGYSSSSDEVEPPSKEEVNEPVPGHSFSMVVADDSSSDSAPDMDDEVSRIEIQPDIDVKFPTSAAQAATEAYPTQRKLSDAPSLKNWIEETDEHLITSTDGTSNAQQQRAQSLLSRINSVARRVVQPTIDEVEQNEPRISGENRDVQMLTEESQPTALQIAEDLERNAASSGLHWEEGAVAQPMRLEGIQRGDPAIGLLQLDPGGSLSYALQSATLRREHGMPQALAVHLNYIAVGLSKGGILVIPSKYSATRIADETDAKHFVLSTPGPDKSVSSMCFSQQGDLLLVGYSNGHLVLWDVPKANVIKTLEKEHSVAIVHTLFLGQDIPGARNFKAITSDSKGLTLLHTFTVLPVPVLRRYTVNTSCILDGQRTGIVLSVSPLLPEEGSQNTGGTSTAPHGGSSVPMNLSSVMGVVGGATATASDVGRKFLYDGAASEDNGGGLVVFVTHQVALVVRLLPSVEVCARLSRPEGIREGAIPYTAWRRTKSKAGISTGAMVPSSTSESGPVSLQKDDGRPFESSQSQEAASVDGMVKVNADGGENCPSLAIAWDKKILIYQLPKSELKSVAQWEVDSPVVGVAWLEEQMMVVATSKDQLCLFTNEGVEIERAVLETEHGGIGAFIYHTHFMNLYGNPEKAYHNALAVRGAALYLLGPSQLWRARLLPWKDRIKALENAGDWMGAFHIAMEIYDGRSQGVTGLPKGLDAMREAIMPTLLALLSAYIDEAFAYLSLALGPSSSTPVMKIAPEPIKQQHELSQTQGSTARQSDNGVVEAREQYARVGGVAIEFCVHIRKTEVLFENVFSKFEAVGQRGTFLELLEPYILKDMLGGLAPEVMQALVEHYSSRCWLNRVEQCVLHMDIGSLDFNQVVRVCRDHGLYSALIYLFTKGLDDFKSPLEELFAVAQKSTNLSQANAFGYKLLVYLKYCFTGLAFPPGNGTLSPSRLPNLRAELLDYILDPMGTKREGNESMVPKLYPRLLYLLKLDTQGSLSVLGAAFPEQGPLGVGTREWVYSSGIGKSEQGDGNSLLHSQSRGSVLATGEIVKEGLNLAQKTIDAVTHILQFTHIGGQTAVSESEPISSNERWPTDKDTGEMLEFVAHFAAGKYAVVTSAIMPHILEHLTSPAFNLSAVAELSEKRKLVTQKQREDLMVALLRVVPKSEWDAQRTLRLAQNAGYWQVTALLYAQKSDYTAALDNYLKDATRPQHPFTFISYMLSSGGRLEGSSLSNFREAVLSRLPQLIELSTVSTLLVVLKHLSNENQRILRELAPHPKLLFNYLKSVMDIRSIDLDDSSLELEGDVASSQQSASGESADLSRKAVLSGHGEEKDKDQSVLDSQVYLADLLQRSGLEFTNEMAETFVELLCRFEPESVLKFLERYENYRLEHCLKLCQDYGITDAATFLLERVGDVGSALSLVLANVDKSMQDMDQALLRLANTLSFTENYESSTGSRFLNLPEVVVVHSVLRAAVALCQRNTFSLEPQKSESLWFRLFDSFVEPLHSFNKQMKSASHVKQHAIKSEVNHRSEQEAMSSKNGLRWKVWGNDLASKLLRKVLAQFIGDIVNGMMGYVPLPTIMNKILEEHRGHEFGDFKETILDMLSAYGYERAILGTAKQLIEDDAFENISALKRGCTHAFSPTDSTCAVCGRRLDEPGPEDVQSKNTSPTSSTQRPTKKDKLDEETQSSSSNLNQLGIRIFPCGHATHVSCVEVRSGSESRRSWNVAICPICSHIRQTVNLSSHGKDSSLVKGGVLDGRRGKSKKHDGNYSLKEGSPYKTISQVSRHSRLQLLKHLEDGTELHELGMPLQLKLAPMITLNKRVSTTNSGSGRLRGTGKSSLATSSRGENAIIIQRRLKPRAR
ncbi:unnamed protein product [Calypogeia fissa]